MKTCHSVTGAVRSILSATLLSEPPKGGEPKKELYLAERVRRAHGEYAGLMDSGLQGFLHIRTKEKVCRGREGEKEAAVLRVIPENPQEGSCESPVGGVFLGGGGRGFLSFFFFL